MTWKSIQGKKKKERERRESAHPLQGIKTVLLVLTDPANNRISNNSTVVELNGKMRFRVGITNH